MQTFPHGGAHPLTRASRPVVLVLLLIAATFAAAVAPSARAAVPTLYSPTSGVPAGFTKKLLAKGLKKPTVIAFGPKGDIYLGMQGGAVLIYRNGAVLPTPVVTLNTDSAAEKGLLGMALDPNFASNGFLYVSYTTLDEHAILTRLTVKQDVASLTSEKVLLKGNQLQNPHHSANDLKIGADGKLWWSVGDNVPSISNGRTLSNIYGKILRFNLDGTVPSDNPFINVVGAVPYIYAFGLRNPFRFDFLPNGKAIEMDTGSSYWEEMNTIQRGGNFGWDIYEGNCGSCGGINPVYAYGHLPVDGAASAIAAYTGTAFPQQYNHVVFFGDYVRGDIEAVTFDTSYRTELSDVVFDNAAGTIADLMVGPDGNLYYVSIFEGTFTKISAKGPFAPTAAAAAIPSAGKGPLTVQFSSAGSTEAYGKALTYAWDFGDGSAASTLANPAHIYATNGSFTATLTVSNGTLTGTATTQVVVGQSPPSASITTPTVNTTYSGGDTINFSGTATDAVDGTLPASAYSWSVDFYTNGVAQPFYTYEVPAPFYGPVSGATSGSFTIPRDLSNGSTTFYRITLTVKNSQGLTNVVKRDIKPNQTTWSVGTNVPGAGYWVDGTWHTTPYTNQDGVGIQHVLAGVRTQTVNGSRYRFDSWSDGSALTDAFTTGAATTNLTANYDLVSGTMPGAWQSADVGAPLVPGSADYAASSGTFYVDGAGADVYNSNDQFHYVYQTLTGNGTITARVRYQTNSSAWAKAGLMIKQSTTAGSPYVDVLTTPTVSPSTPNINGVGCTPDGCASPLPPVTPSVGYGVRMQYNFKGSQSVSDPTTLAGFASPNEWLRLKRVGNTFTSWYSTDGTTWKLIGKTTFTMNTQATIGMFVCSHNIGQTSTAAFDNVSIVPGP